MRSLLDMILRKSRNSLTTGSSSPRLATVGALLFVIGLFPVTKSADAQHISAGVDYILANQGPDGGWQSTEVRRVQAINEALWALQTVGAAPSVRSAAADLLELELVSDTDDRARRIVALAGEGRTVESLVSQLLEDAGTGGGWGLTADFGADPLNTALALIAVAPLTTVGNDVVVPAISSLLAAQKEDGGWPCVVSGDDDADSEIFCTSYALLALSTFRDRFYLTPQIESAVGFLHGQRNPDGSFGPAGPDEVINSALASRAVAAVPAFGAEVAFVVSRLQGLQQPDGSWNGDPYPTALAVHALQAMSAVPYCGDGAINQPAEACDLGDLGGLSCESIGLGAGSLACSSLCTLDTSGCSAPPICGDNLRNQPFEICDGTDLAAESCESLGFASGDLACAGDCLSFDVSSCNATASCGDGIVNQPSELCDLSDLDGATCESLGLGGGLLSCAPDCNLDTSLCDASSYSIDNKGREFFVGYMKNYATGAVAALHLTSDTPTSVTIQYPVVSPSFSQTVPVNPGDVTIVNLPTPAWNNWSAGRVLNNAVRLSAPDDFVVYLVNRRRYTTDAGMALPVDALGTSYIVSTYRASYLYSGDRSQFLVVAPFDDTTVTVTPATTLRLNGGTTPPNVPFQITLDRGEGFRGEAAYFRTDLTGTLIEANRPVAMVNGNICTNVPTNVTYCDHIFEVGHPVRSWGTSALLTNLPRRPSGSIYRVVASKDGTDVSLDGVLQATLGRGEFLELGPIPGNHVVTANEPIFVTQFMTGSSSPGASLGDPAMANMIPPEQFVEDYTFSTVGGGQFAYHYLTVTVPDSSVDSALLDGAAIGSGAFSPVASSGFSSSVLSITEGTHLTSTIEPHGITVEGVNQDDSYLYPGGARLEFINQFCGDGVVNQTSEECDRNDFEGANCTSFGFSAGFLQCTVDCRIDTSQCSGFTSEDKDEDGFPATEDCDDRDPEVNPGMDEIPGNGIDDDCNPSTPDAVPSDALSCRVAVDRISYTASDTISPEAVIENSDPLFSLTGLVATLVIRGDGGVSVFEEVRQMAPLPPGARAQLNFAVSASGFAPGDYMTELTIDSTADPAAFCETGFAVESSTTTGAGLTGTLDLDPELVNAGESSDARYVVENRGNTSFVDLQLRVLLLDPDTGAEVGEVSDLTTLAEGAIFSASQPLSSQGLAVNKSYLAVLLAEPSGTDTEITLDTASLTVVNAPPDCLGAFADRERLWPPNHKYVRVEIDGVTDPDGDPVTITTVGVLQDERTDHKGDGKTCPDATGVGSSRPKIRAERSGQQDGRVYHIFFTADDGRGGQCDGEVEVCVPHDRKDSCGDQGALYESTTCP